MSIYCPIEVFIPAFGEKLYSMSIGYSNSSGGQSFGLKGESGCECPTQSACQWAGLAHTRSLVLRLAGARACPLLTGRGEEALAHGTKLSPAPIIARTVALPAALLPRFCLVHGPLMSVAVLASGVLCLHRVCSPALGSGDSSTLRPLFALWPHPPAPSLVQVRAVAHS